MMPVFTFSLPRTALNHLYSAALAYIAISIYALPLMAQAPIQPYAVQPAAVQPPYNYPNYGQQQPPVYQQQAARPARPNATNNGYQPQAAPQPTVTRHRYQQPLSQYQQQRHNGQPAAYTSTASRKSLNQIVQQPAVQPNMYSQAATQRSAPAPRPAAPQPTMPQTAPQMQLAQAPQIQQAPQTAPATARPMPAMPSRFVAAQNANTVSNPQNAQMSANLGYNRPSDRTGSAGTQYAQNTRNSPFPTAGNAFPDASESATPNSDWKLVLGLGFAGFTEYEGADTYMLMIAPWINASYKDTFFFNPQRGLGANLINTNGLKAGVSLTGSRGRDNSDIKYLRGTGDIDFAVMAGGFADYTIKMGKGKGVMLTSSLHQDVSDAHDGFVAGLGASYTTPLTQEIILRSNIGTTYASEDYMQSFFGISAAQSAASGIAQYTPEAGFKDVSASTNLIFRLDDHWSLVTIGEYQRLVGDAADSIIVDLGSENQWLFGSFVSYTF